MKDGKTAKIVEKQSGARQICRIVALPLVLIRALVKIL